MPNKIANSGLWAAADLLRLPEPTFDIRPLGNKIYRRFGERYSYRVQGERIGAQNQPKAKSGDLHTRIIVWLSHGGGIIVTGILLMLTALPYCLRVLTW